MGATPAWPPKSAPRLFLSPSLTAGAERVIDGAQAHYLARVMRVSSGDTIILCDDETGEWAAKVVGVEKRRVLLQVQERLRERESVPDFVLCAALTKKPAFDLVLEKATELGVSAIRPVVTRRCVATSLNADRARTIMTEAAEQCARTALPALEETTPLKRLVSEWEGSRALYFADEAGDAPPALEAFRRGPSRAALIVGPEGGFDEEERAMLRALPAAQPVALGPRILRAETAAIAATALWMAAAGDWSEMPLAHRDGN